jgi:hypothetical protein
MGIQKWESEKQESKKSDSKKSVINYCTWTKVPPLHNFCPYPNSGEISNVNGEISNDQISDYGEIGTKSKILVKIQSWTK